MCFEQRSSRRALPSKHSAFRIPHSAFPIPPWQLFPVPYSLFPGSQFPVSYRLMQRLAATVAPLGARRTSVVCVHRVEGGS